MSTMTIGQVAKSVAISVETIRFYEQKGLIPKPERTPSGYRKYSPTTIDQLRFIQRAKNVGFTLSDISDLMVLRTDPESCCADVMVRAKMKLDDINQKLEELNEMKLSLQTLVSACDGNTAIADCPIIEQFESPE